MDGYEISYVWEDAKNRSALYRVYKRLRDGYTVKHMISHVNRTRDNAGFVKWRSFRYTYHARKRDAKRASINEYMVLITDVNSKLKLPDLTNAYWSEETVGDNRYDVLRVQEGKELHQIATVYEAYGYMWAAIRGKGHHRLDGASTYEEARAVTIALIRME